MNSTIPTRFVEQIQVHVIANLVAGPTSDCPLFLGIHGRPGDGKTFQTLAVLQAFGLDPHVISGGEFESESAGQPAANIKEKYLRAGQLRSHADGRYPVLVLNDLDAGVGDWGPEVQYTVNRQIVLGELMHLADTPGMVDGKPANRVPVIITANDFQKIYPPLLRPGRMRLFEWCPTTFEKVEILASFFVDLPTASIHQMVADYPDQPISFFSAIRQRLQDRYLLERIRRDGFSGALSGAAKHPSMPMSYGEVAEEAAILARSLVLDNHLERSLPNGHDGDQNPNDSQHVHAHLLAEGTGGSYFEASRQHF